ncbi:hypothetical protein [Clostridioides difficile]|uniref:hypothetical protein n=1 Tax=Clostridioides difficile TaxID=1496 RepID=UPI000D1F7F75|nr:hypothetical protein [Clostridioides difficile]HBE9444508.1 hypothetical protein [Clostridioides difficile]
MLNDFDKENKIRYIYYSNFTMKDILNLYKFINMNIYNKKHLIEINKEILYIYFSKNHKYRNIMSNEHLYILTEKKLFNSIDNILSDINLNIVYLNSLNKHDCLDELDTLYNINFAEPGHFYPGCNSKKKINKNNSKLKAIYMCFMFIIITLIVINLNSIKSTLDEFVPVKDVKVSENDKSNLGSNYKKEDLSLREAINSLPEEKQLDDNKEYNEYTNKYLSLKVKYPATWEVKENIATIQNLVRESKNNHIFDLAYDKAKLAGILVEFIANDPFETRISLGVSPLESNVPIQSLASILDENIVKQIDKQIRINIEADGNKIISNKGTDIKKIDKNEVIVSEYVFKNTKKENTDTSVIQVICPNGLNNIILTAVSKQGENSIDKYNILTQMLKTLGVYDINKELIEVG